MTNFYIFVHKGYIVIEQLKKYDQQFNKNLYLI